MESLCIGAQQICNGGPLPQGTISQTYQMLQHDKPVIITQFVGKYPRAHYSSCKEVTMKLINNVMYHVPYIIEVCLPIRTKTNLWTWEELIDYAMI